MPQSKSSRMIRSTNSLCFYSSLSTGAIVGIVVPAVVAVLAVVAALFYRFKFKSVEKAYNQLYNIHTDTTQQQTDVPVAFSTSLIGNNTAPASRVGVRNVAPSAQSFGHDLQPSHTGSPAPFPISSVSETSDTRGIAVPSDQSRVIYDFLCILLYSADIFWTAILTQACSKRTASGAVVVHWRASKSKWK